MRSLAKKNAFISGMSIVIGCLLILAIGFFIVSARTAGAETTPVNGERLITIHDAGVDRVILTRASTLGEALKGAGVVLNEQDLVEPGLDHELVASNYDVNVYRARPVTIVDGSVRQKVLSPYHTAMQIAKQAGITLYAEDEAEVAVNTVTASREDIGLEMTVKRATPFTLTLYGKTTTARTQATTVGEMLKEKDIKLEANDRVSVATSTAINPELTVRVWREGKQTVTIEEEVNFETEIIKDTDRPVSYKEVKTPGAKGSRNVTYEVTVQDGHEVARTEIASLVTKEPVKQVEIVGAKTSSRPLTKAMGVNQFTDSNGVTHRETYYDLPMKVVMGNCGAGGFYTVRGDGAKVDRDGYVIIAANLSRYPRCSVVETSLGMGKVYDTGGFAAKHPDGWDLATDWSDNNGI